MTPLRETIQPKWIERGAAALPLALGVAMMATNRWFTEVDDECAIIDRAARPLRETVALYLQGIGQHEHPPLYDVLLHGWLKLTDANNHLLRLPSVLFYIVGAWVLSAVAKRLGGTGSQFWTIAIIVLSPFGFHFGRLATWYSFCFLLVSLLTLFYLRFVEAPGGGSWAWLVTVSLALVYANYLGWVFLGLIAIDYTVRKRREIRSAASWLALTAAVLLLAYIPILRAFRREAQVGTHSNFFSISSIVNVAYNLYTVFISESVGPWHWVLGIPGVIAVAVCLIVVLLWCPFPPKAFLLYFFGLVIFLTALGVIVPKRTLFMTPWLALPVGIALGTMSNQTARRILIGGLALCAGIGWYGIFARDLYGAPHWVEPWDSIAQRSANVVRDGGIVIGNNPSFFFYLTYLLPGPGMQGRSFEGLLPDSIRRANVYTPQQWMQAGRPTASTTLFVRGLHFGGPAEPTDEAQAWLDSHCTLNESTKLVRDAGAELKQRISTVMQPEWRIEVRGYACR